MIPLKSNVRSHVLKLFIDGFVQYMSVCNAYVSIGLTH